MIDVMLNSDEAQAFASLTRFMKNVIELFEAWNELGRHEDVLNRLFGQREMDLLRDTARQGLNRMTGGTPETREISEVWSRYQEISDHIAPRNGHKITAAQSN